ncbi:hypothetical protein GCM10010468_70810 [Actinocorallia longicatena]|uniref:Uncharacterized protein n=1 Tax=Actinocorallia longicatena TaxID=111803 RepID=A0ABP6QL92_9ACTN
MGHRTQARLPHDGERLPEVRITRQIGTDHEHVDETADQIVQRLVGTARHRRADRDVRAGAEPRQHHGEGRLEHHEDGDALLASEVGDPAMHLGRDPQRHLVPEVARHRGPRPVRRQAQLLRHPGEHAAPVAELTRDQAVRIVLRSEQVALPERVVGVLDGQRLPHRSLAAPARLVRRRHVPAQGGHGPAVGRDVVQQQHQGRVLRSRPEQPGPDRHLHREVEGVPGRLRDRSGQFTGGDVDLLDAPVELVQVEDPLVRLAVDLREHRP